MIDDTNEVLENHYSDISDFEDEEYQDDDNDDGNANDNDDDHANDDDDEDIYLRYRNLIYSVLQHSFGIATRASGIVTFCSVMQPRISVLQLRIFFSVAV